MGLHPELTDILLRPIRPERVKRRQGGGGKDLSYVEGYDIRAALNRMFGFLNWSIETKVDILNTTQRLDDEGKPKSWVVTAQAFCRLTIHYRNNAPDPDNENPFGTDRYFAQAHYEDVAADSAINANMGEAVDQAIKSAATGALKRCAANLGDQFGLSLYNDGSMRPVVRVVVGHKSAEERETEQNDPETENRGSATPAVQDEQAVETVAEQLGGEVVDDGSHDPNTGQHNQDSGAFR